MRLRLRGRRRSVDRGTRRQGVELRNWHLLGSADAVLDRGRQYAEGPESLPLHPYEPTDGIARAPGAPPAGDALTFEILAAPDDFFCEGFVDDVALMADEAGIDAMMDTCQVLLEDAEADIRADFVDALNGGEAGDVLLFVEGSAGGCIGEAWIEDVHLDGDVLRPWLLKEDTAFGIPDAACTADWGVSLHLVRVSGAEDATSAELHLGVFNPDLPGAPTAS